MTQAGIVGYGWKPCLASCRARLRDHVSRLGRERYGHTVPRGRRTGPEVSPHDSDSRRAAARRCDTPDLGGGAKRTTVAPRVDDTRADWRTGAHNPAAGPQGPPGQGCEEQDARAEGQPAAPWCLHPRLHDHAQEAELGLAQGRPRAPFLGHRGDRLHPRSRPQLAGALDRARPWWSRERPARRAIQDRARRARHTGRQEPQAARSRYGAKKEKG